MKILQIETYIPNDYILNNEIVKKPDIFFREKIGTIKLPRKNQSSDTSDLCKLVYDKLNIKPECIKMIIVCTQNPDANGIPNTSSILHKKLNLSKNVATLDISHACSGYPYLLNVADGFKNLLKKPSDIILAFTCDPYSKILDHNVSDTAILFGDAATVTVLSNSNDIIGYKPNFFCYFSDGSLMDKINNFKGKLQMDGRAVFNFASNSVPEFVKNHLNKINVKINDIDRFIFHSGSKYIIDTIGKKLGITNKIFYEIESIGNTVSSSIPISFKGIINKNFRLVYICGFGVGLSISGCILNYE